MSLAPMFSSASDHWSTPQAVYVALDDEFDFTFDPCPLDLTATAGASLWGKDGLRKSWAGQRVFCNPPYSEIAPWLMKAREAELAVFLVPSRTDTRWWHEHAMKADEIRFLRGRLRFGNATNSAPFPSVVLVFDRTKKAQVLCPKPNEPKTHDETSLTTEKEGE